MPLFALTGGIAAGKSTVAARWAALGATVLDADRLAREVVERDSPALAEIAARFGTEVIAADGSLDRAALGAIVFADDAARRDLEAITHPAIADLAERRIQERLAEDPGAVVVYDIPLLVETGAPLDRYDAVVVVHAPASERHRRLTEVRGLSAEEATRRIAAQATDDERLAIATHVIDAGRSLEDTRSEADRVWRALTASSTEPHPSE